MKSVLSDLAMIFPMDVNRKMYHPSDCGVFLMSEG